MSAAVHEELLRFVMTKTDDPEVQARQRLFLRVYAEMNPELMAEVEVEREARAKAAMEARIKAEVEAEARKEGLDMGRVSEARSALRRVLARRKLPLTAEEEARIDACTNLPTLERWLDQAVEAKSAAEALQ